MAMRVAARVPQLHDCQLPVQLVPFGLKAENLCVYPARFRCGLQYFDRPGADDPGPPARGAHAGGGIHGAEILCGFSEGAAQSAPMSAT
jgi:hypothetical protein